MVIFAVVMVARVNMQARFNTGDHREALNQVILTVGQICYPVRQHAWNLGTMVSPSWCSG
jgi:hypothetical protein